MYYNGCGEVKLDVQCVPQCVELTQVSDLSWTLQMPRFTRRSQAARRRNGEQRVELGPPQPPREEVASMKCCSQCFVCVCTFSVSCKMCVYVLYVVMMMI